jgi:glycerate-2-kinase
MDPKAFLRSQFDAAVAHAQPSHVIRSHLPSPPPGRTVVVGAGKAAAAMAFAVDGMNNPWQLQFTMQLARRGRSWTVLQAQYRSY